MTRSDALVYVPRWDYRGDPDTVAGALAYGAISMTIIWTIENLAHRLLFTAGRNLSISESAALVTFKGSSWWDIFSWTWSTSWLGEEGNRRPYAGCRLNSRALMGVVLRLILILLEIGIIFAFIPRSIVLTEEEVGSSRINFGLRGVQLARNVDDTFAARIRSSCLRDDIPYEGFKVEAFREVCISRLPMNKSVYKSLKKQLKSAVNFSERFVVLARRDEKDQVFIFIPNERIFFHMHHRIQLLGEKAPTTSDSQIFRLPVPQNIVYNLVNLTVSLPRRARPQRMECRPALPLSVNSDFGAMICKMLTTIDFPFSFFFNQILISIVHTEKAKPSLQKYAYAGFKVERFLEIGTLSRPRLCLFPALIALALLACTNLGVWFIFGEENISLKLFHLSKEAAHIDSMRNPLFTERDVLNFQVRNIHGQRTFGYLH